MEVFALKFVEKTLLKEWEKLAQSSPKILAQNNDKNPQFIGQKNIVVGVCQSCRSTARSTGNGQKSDRYSLRSTGPVDREEQRALLSVPVDRPGRPHKTARRAQFCARRSTGPVDRPLCNGLTWSTVLRSKTFEFGNKYIG